MKRWLFLTITLALAACGGGGQVEPLPPTATLAPIVSMTPRFTATPVPSRTPLPSATFTPSQSPIPPSPTNTFTPSPTPPITGIIASLQSVNVRTGPGLNFELVAALPPSTGVLVLGRNTDGTWLNIRLDDGREGWVSAALIRLRETPTPFPTSTRTPDLTAIALGTIEPTALISGLDTPTPPRSVVTPTLPGTPAAPTNTPALGGVIQLPDIEAINQTGTALFNQQFAQTLTPFSTSSGGLPVITNAPPVLGSVTPQVRGEPTVQTGTDVHARCDVPDVRRPAPTDLAAGSTIDVFWHWYAQTLDQINDHLATVTYDIRLDGVPLTNYRASQSAPRQAGNNYVVEWFVRSQPLEAGTHVITYRATWSRPINDGFERFGPGTENPEELGTCTFVVR